jgi:osmotically-inducible protein OsmY
MAERVVQRVKGVRAIAEEFEVRLPLDPKHADDEIAARAINIFEWQVGFQADRIAVKVEKGIVTLTGEVEWRFQKTDAEHAVHKLTGIIGPGTSAILRNGRRGRHRAAPQSRTT